MENPDIRVLADLRKELGEEIEELKARIAKLEEYVRGLDETLSKSSFTTADVALAAASRAPPPGEPEVVAESGTPRIIPVMSKDRSLTLATIEVIDQTLRIIPAEHAVYDIKRGAFARFFVERILGTYQQEDKTRAENKEISWDDTFDFEIKSDDDGILEEVVIHNFGGESRLTDIERALRWALEKTYTAR
ncbi:MAG: hypothetical protein ACP6KW_04570 [Candidatus Thorarchaeota archaeon]